MTPSRKSDLPMSSAEARLLTAHSRGKHADQKVDLCPMCRDPEFWTKNARRIHGQFLAGGR